MGGNTARLPPITYGNLTSPTAPSQQGRSGSEKMPALGDNTMASFANLDDDTGLEDNDDVDYDEHYKEEKVEKGSCCYYYHHSDYQVRIKQGTVTTLVLITEVL